MRFISKKAILFFLVSVVLLGCVLVESENGTSERLRSAPHKNVGNIAIDGTGTEKAIDFQSTPSGLGDSKKGNYNKVYVGHGCCHWFRFQFLEQYREVSMLDIKGVDATKVVLVIGIVILHLFGEGSGVGVSFAGSKGFS